MSTGPIQNNPAIGKNWQAAINSVQAKDQQLKSEKAAPSTPSAPPTELPAIPSRRAPKAADADRLQEGLGNLNKTKMQFSIRLLKSLMFDLANEQKIIMRKSRQSDVEVAVDMYEAGADDMRDEAVMGLAGATTMATMQVAGAATVIGGGISQAKVGDTMMVSNKMMGFQAGSQVFGSVGSMTQGAFNYEAKMDEAQKASHDAAATKAKSLEESDNEDAKDEQQLVQSLIQLNEKLEESRHEAKRATA